MHLDTAAACALIGAASGWFVPQLIARLPEPAAEPEPQTADEVNPLDEAAPEKALYVDLAATPGLAWKSALASGVTAGVIGLATGWIWPLMFLLYLCPIGVALAFVDLRTWLLPTRIIAPSYLVVLALGVLAAGVTGDWRDLARLGAGWLCAGLLFYLLWRFSPGMGYGDVRLAGLVGMALGYLGWGELLTGLYAGFLVGVLAWIPLRLLRVTKTRHFPFGPFILIGAVVGVVWGEQVGSYLVAR